MYHAFVRRNGQWRSFGLHVASNQWSEFFNTLKRAFGEDNVACTFRPLNENFGEGYDVERYMRKEVEDANAVQEARDNGSMPTHDESGYPFSLAYGIAHLRDFVH